MKKTAVITIMSGLIFILAAAGPQIEETGKKPMASITEAELRDHIFFLASDALEGRYLGSKGYEIAALYGASQFQAAGLEPLMTSEEESTYLQDVPVVKRRIKDEPYMLINTPGGETKFQHGSDFKWIEGEIDPTQGRRLPVVFVGYGISEPEHGWDDFKGLDIENKVVVMMFGAPLRKGEPVLPPEAHKKYASAAGWQNKLMGLISKKTAAVFLIGDEQLHKMWDKLPAKTRGESYALQDSGLGVLIPLICAVKPGMAEAMLADQHEPLSRLSDPGLEGYSCFELKDTDIEIGTSFDQEPVPTWNVVGMVKGTDPVLSQECITVTAHLDHLEPRGGEICNGADDNASGSAGVMEIAEAVAMDPPRRSVVFVLFTKEEGGVLGSRHFVAAGPVPIDRVVVNLNLDMIGRTDAYSKGDRSHYALDSDKVTPELKKALMEVNRRTVNWPLKFDRPRNAPGVGSDNIIFDMQGIPSVFFYSGSHRDYHRPTDDADKIEYDKVEKISRLVYALTMELGNREKLW